MIDERQHQFILRAYDPALGCSVLEAMLRIDDLDSLRVILGEHASDDAELRQKYWLEPDELRAINLRFGTGFDPGGRECWLSRLHSINEIPYLIHTGYELPLMLDGRKPFAKFTVELPVEPDDDPQLALFEPHVQSGVLIKRVMPDEPFKKPITSPSGRVYDGVRRVFYALPGEEWRIDAYLLVWKQLKHGPWNETLERLDGSLLGYTDAQNEWWQARRRRNNASTTYTDRTVHVAVGATELAWIHSVGERAFRPERMGADLELIEYHWPPEPPALAEWLAACGAAAIVRVGVPQEFLRGRVLEQRDGATVYSIKPEDVVGLRACSHRVESGVAKRVEFLIQDAGWVGGQHRWRSPILMTCAAVLQRQ